MIYGPKTQAFYEKNKRLEKDNPLANLDETLSYEAISNVIDIQQFREDTDAFFKDYTEAPLPEDIAISYIEHPLAKLIVFKPKGITLPAPTMVYSTAGGFTLDMSEAQKLHCCKLALRTNALVISLTPRLAPEIKLPQIVREAYGVVKFLYAHAEQYHIDRDNFFLTGFSAGSMLSMFMALRAVHDPDLSIKGMALISGNYDISQESAMEEDDIRAREHDFMAKPGMMKFFISQYLPSFDQDLKDPEISPYYADVKGLPPTTLIAGSCDAFLGDSKAMAKKLKAHGVDVQLIINPGHIHNTTSMYDSELGDGEDPILQAADSLKKYLP